MLKSVLAALTLVLLAASSSFAGTTFTPTTTLAAETANNTSAADSFTQSSNGNAGAGNVSQESIHKLLYSGSNSKVYAHYLGWWGSSSHINIGYDSATITQAHKQISDMMNRGIDGLIIDWYGAGNAHINQASLYIKQDAETRGGNFTFAIMEDQGAVKSCAYDSNCNATQKLIDDFNYIVTTYASSPAYMRVNGQPVIFTFDTENLPNIDWTKVMAGVQGNPKIVLRNDHGFRYWFTSGSYAWVAINKQNQNDWGQGYLDDFYVTSRSYPSELVYPGVWKGFNDTLASWSENRIMNQNCGQVWLTTVNELNKYFSTTTQAPGVQLVTWNDYEEGTEIETGIDNCVSVSGSVSGSTLYWSISGGQENTIDHYTVFITEDGENLMKVADVPSGTHQLDLSQYGFAPTNYGLYVKAVGRPAILNKITAEIPYSITNLPPVAVLNVNPTSGVAPVLVTASTAGSSDPDGTIVATSIDFGDGTVVNSPSASHTYSTAGTYSVIATVTDNDGATSSANATVTVTNATVFSITPITPLDGSTVGQLVHFVATSTSPSPVTTMRIYVDNVSKYSVNAPSIDTYLQLPIGPHYVVLQGWNQQGQIAKTPLNITVVNLPPVASLIVTPVNGVAPVNVTATASGTDPDGKIASISIDFGDGTVVNSGVATHTYTKAGKYNVIATVTDNNGAMATAKTTVTVVSGIVLTRPDRDAVEGDLGNSMVAITTTAKAATPIVSMHVSVDRKPRYSLDSLSSDAGTLDTTLSLSKGPHYILVEAWDATGEEYKSESTIDVK